MHGHRWRLYGSMIGAVALTAATPAAPPEPRSAGEIAQELRSFQELGTVLFVAAHPDDENSRILTWLARGRGYRTAYLSLTRGDGGQNLLGPELREALGLIRTEELLAARRIDGCEQFFSRAIDFGFSKTPEETLAIWDKAAVLGDVVRIIRQYQPDVLMVPFSPESGGRTHGHHTSSAILAMEAFKIAGDPKAYPEQLDTLRPWQPRRVVLARWWGGENEPAIEIDIGGFDPVSGKSFGEIAAESRSMHKSQGMGSLGTRGRATTRFQVIAGDAATRDIFEGIDSSWARVGGGDAVARAAQAALAAFDPLNPSASVPALLGLRRQLAALPDHSAAVEAKRRQLDRILQGALGLYVESTVPEAEVVPGEELKLKHTVVARAGHPVRWVAVCYPGHGADLPVDAALEGNVPASQETTRVLARETPLSQPYWLRHDGSTGLARVDDPALIGRAENPPAFPVDFVFEVDGQTLVVADEPVQVGVDRVKGERRRRLEVIAPASLRFADDVALFAPRASRTITVEVEAARAGITGTLRLETAADGWTVTPAEQAVRLGAAGERASYDFVVQAPESGRPQTLSAVIDIDGRRTGNRHVAINYDHIPPLLLQPPARLRGVVLDLATRGRSIGYVAGAGDAVAEALARMGYAVTALGEGDLTTARLQEFDAVVFGIRAFSARPELAAHLPAVFEYVSGGGTVLVQYNTPERSLTTFDPLSVRMARNERVTDETATMSLLAPDHPALNTPNTIGPDDFSGWVQERGLYFPTDWSPEFTPLLACADPGESVKNGALLVAHHGKGYFIYTGLAFFRQLPEGVPGAYRLMANLVSLGK